jgi:hypothetical protein
LAYNRLTSTTTGVGVGAGVVVLVGVAAGGVILGEQAESKMAAKRRYPSVLLKALL